MGHTWSNLLVHVVFSTKDRLPTIHADFRLDLYKYLTVMAEKKAGRLYQIGGTENHVHALLSVGTDISLGEAMRVLKCTSSGWVHDTFPQHAAFGWQGGYGAFSVSLSNKAAVIEYIQGQAAHHRTKTFEEEFLALLNRHGVEYDPRYVWR